jgi:REP element-mobilizing transposase RayT
MFLLIHIPRALPWASMGEAVGLVEIHRTQATKNIESIRVLLNPGAPKARPMIAQGNALGGHKKQSQALKGRPIDPCMPQSLSRIYLHLVFSTKGRAPIIKDQIRDSLHRYMATVLKNIGCHANLINSVEDHVHVLFEFGRTVALSKVVEDIKKSSSKWIKTRPTGVSDFAWQNGYGVFSVSHSNLEAMRDYIASQREHHRKRTFQDELRTLLDKHGVKYDERYIWA